MDKLKELWNGLDKKQKIWFLVLVLLGYSYWLIDTSVYFYMFHNISVYYILRNVMQLWLLLGVGVYFIKKAKK